MKSLVNIGEAVSALGVSITTLRRWKAKGKRVAEHTVGGQRRYDLTKLRPDLFRADVLEIITAFSARLYASRSRKHRKRLDGLKKTVEEAHADCA